MITKIENFVQKFLKDTENKKINLISHFDTDGITSAAIISKTFDRLDKSFSVKILKQLSEKEVKNIQENEIIFFTDLGSGSLKDLGKIKSQFFIIDHHEIEDKEQIPENVTIINTHLFKEYEELCSAELSYLFSKKISKDNKDLAHLSIIGAVGDTMEKNITKTRNIILNDSNVKIKKGFLIYPSTRPLNKALEFSSRPFIPGVTGNAEGTINLLKEAGIERVGRTYKSLIDLKEDEMKRLVTAVLLRTNAQETKEYIGNLYLIKFFNKIEDARELSAIINACSRMGQSHIALLLCMGNTHARKKAERIYVKYRQTIISGLRYIDKNEKIQGREYVIINAKDKIKDTIIGTLASIISFSSVYKKGTIIIAMAYNEDKIKISTRISGRNHNSPRNLREIMDYVTNIIGGNSGGHKYAAGCVISKDKEEEFIKLIQKKLAFELVKI